MRSRPSSGWHRSPQGLHMTPHRWLHMTALAAGPATRFSSQQLQRMTPHGSQSPCRHATRHHHTRPRSLPPRGDHARRSARRAAQPIRGAALQATRLVTGVQETGTAPPGWIPHITICYSTCDRPAQPLIVALGFRLPSCDIQVSALGLVIQRGPERAWSWSVIDTVHLGQPART